MTSTRHLGLDLGGTNLKWAVLEYDGAVPRVLDQGQQPSAVEAGPGHVIDRFVSIADDAARRWSSISTIGIGVPGRYDPATGSARFLVNLPGGWRGVAIAEPVQRATGLPVVLINDARAFGLAELRLGAGRGARSMVGLTLGTGIGGVIAIDGRIHHGHDGTGGEIGHQTIDPDGPPCNCGGRGCLEAFARADRIAAACGTASVEEAVAAARSGVPAATRGLAEVGRMLGIGIANAITLITPDRVVIGGGVAAAGDLLLDPIRAELTERVRMTALDRVALMLAGLGVWAGAIGAAAHGAESAT